MPEAPSSNPPSSLIESADIIPTNFRSLMGAIEPLGRTGQAVFQGIHTLLEGGVEISTDGQIAANIMCLYSWFAWNEAMVLTGSGHLQTGFSAARRSIEFCCYAAKVVGNDQRAEDWLAAGEDAAARVRFHKACQIPVAYDTADYRLLWPLIAFYDFASDYGVHANFKSLAGAYGGSTEKQIFLNQQADKDKTIPATFLLTGLGYRIYRAMLRILKPCITDGKKQDQTFEYVREEVKKLRLGSARSHFRGQVPERILYDILADRATLSVQQFKAYVQRSKKKCPNCGGAAAPQPDKCLECGGEVVPQPNKCSVCNHEF